MGGDAGIIGGIKIMRIIEGIIYGFSYPILACGVAIYILQHFFGKTEPPSFELAIISAIIGGFALSSGFLEKVSSGLQLTIRRIGTFYLGAAIAFVVFALVMPMAELETEGITYWVVFWRLLLVCWQLSGSLLMLQVFLSLNSRLYFERFVVRNRARISHG